MILKRQILLKAIVTEKLKEQLIQDVKDAIQRVEESQDELDRQSRRLMLELQRTDLNRAMAFRQQLDVEKRKQEDVTAALQEQPKEHQELQLGERLTRGTLDGEVEAQVGANLAAK